MIVFFFKIVNDQEKKKTYKQVKNRYKLLKSPKMLRVWTKQVQTGTGDREEKLIQISQHVLEMFKAAEQNLLIVKDMDIKRWALWKYRELGGGFKFTASDRWLHHFKTRYSIVSRKVTRFVHRTHHVDQENVKKAADEFVEKAREKCHNYLPAHIFNTDQSGINIELHSGRSLATKGTQKIEKTVQSPNATSHSYTIQPCINQNGEIQLPMLMCWQEPTGTFGPRVRENLFDAENLYVIATKSGKMTTATILDWFKNVYFKYGPRVSVLIVDSWNGYKDEAGIRAQKPRNNEFTMMIIPPHATPLIQPLDCHFNRHWKAFTRHFYDRVLLDGLNIDVS